MSCYTGIPCTCCQRPVRSQYYDRIRKWWATDACGNVSDTATQMIHVIDIVKPTVSGQGNDTTIYCPATAVFHAPTAKDNCDVSPKLDSLTDVVGGTSCARTYT